VIQSGRWGWARHVAHMGDRRGGCRILMGRPEGKTSLRRRRHRWDDSFKWVFKKWDGDAWTGLLWLRLETGGGCL